MRSASVEGKAQKNKIFSTDLNHTVDFLKDKYYLQYKLTKWKKNNNNNIIAESAEQLKL